jgi:putative transposase
MITLLLHLLPLLPLLCGGHRQLALENLALRQQLAVYKRTTNRPRLRRSDRLLWVWLSRVWPAWRQALVIVAPATVLRWQRRRFRRTGPCSPDALRRARPLVDAAIKALVRNMAAANPPAPWPVARSTGRRQSSGIRFWRRTGWLCYLRPVLKSPPNTPWPDAARARAVVNRVR